jgi:hypothetical protein
MPRNLLFPDDIRRLLRRRYDTQHRYWLGVEAQWPLTIALGDPTEKHVATDAAMIRSWIDAWRAWTGNGCVHWHDRRWPRLGTQQLPERLEIDSPRDVAELVGETGHWLRVSERFGLFVGSWPQLRASSGFARHIDELAEYTGQDFERLMALIAWLEQYRDSGHYLRQLPIHGLDTKWIDASRRGIVTDILQALRGPQSDSDFHVLCGLRRSPHRIRIRLLCPLLRSQLGGLGDIEAPIEQIAELDLRARRIVVVENLETGVALPDYSGTVAFMKLGMSVSVLATLPWLRAVPAIYWGDIDTHGLAILDRARAALPQIQSVLMDQETLLENRSLWGREASAHRQSELSHLTPAERRVFDGLRSNAWGTEVRLEQERIPWSRVVDVLNVAMHGL